MIGFTVGGVKLSFDFTFFGAIAVFLALDKSGFGILCLLACFCHELGHLAVLIAEKNPPKEIVFSGGGICIRQNRDGSALALSAGCAVNFLLFVRFYLLSGRESVYPLVFGGANLLIGGINLLPVGELDGKKLLSRLLYKVIPPNSAEKVLLTVELVFTAAAAGAVFFLAVGSFNLSGVLILLYIFLVDYLQKKC